MCLGIRNFIFSDATFSFKYISCSKQKRTKHIYKHIFSIPSNFDHRIVMHN